MEDEYEEDLEGCGFDVECNECSWQGYAGDLESKTASLSDDKFIYCPDCESDDIQDIDEEE